MVEGPLEAGSPVIVPPGIHPSKVGKPAGVAPSDRKHYLKYASACQFPHCTNIPTLFQLRPHVLYYP